MGHALAPIVGTALLIGIGFGVYQVKVEILLVIAAALTGCLAKYLGLSWREIQAGMLQSIMKGMPAMLIVVVVGALIASWLAAGTIPMLIYYGLGLISAKMFLVTASLATGIVSLLTGTGYGTIGTVGVAFMGIAHGLGVPPGQAAGALVAGAYLGDKISPFAANANFAVAIARVNIYDHIRHCLWTTAPAFGTGLVIYALVGANTAVAANASLAADENVRTVLADHFVFSPWLLLPPVLTLALAIGNRPVLPGMLLAVAVAVALAVWVQGMPLIDALNVTVTGYEPHTGLPPGGQAARAGRHGKNDARDADRALCVCVQRHLAKSGIARASAEPFVQVRHQHPAARGDDRAGLHRGRADDRRGVCVHFAAVGNLSGRPIAGSGSPSEEPFHARRRRLRHCRRSADSLEHRGRVHEQHAWRRRQQLRAVGDFLLRRNFLHAARRLHRLHHVPAKE